MASKTKTESPPHEPGAHPPRRNILLELYQIVPSLVSPDPATRWMSMLFIFSTLSLATVTAVTVDRYMRTREVVKAVEQRKHVRDIELIRKKVSRIDSVRSNTFTLGTFNIELRRPTNQTPQSARTVLNTAEIEIVLICDSIDTREYLEDHVVQTKNQLTDSLTSLERDELMSRGGKRRLKKKMLKSLNQWLLKGKVNEIYFSSLIIS